MKKKSTRDAEQNDAKISLPTIDRTTLFAGFGVALFTFIVFSRVLFNGFVDYDDELYVTENTQVLNGITLSGLSYALTDTSIGNWHPITMMSHMLDCSLFGRNPAGHHLTSLVLHSTNTFLLFLLLFRMTGAIWCSATVALLFGIHPLHVVSVAHAAQRKDVLSTLFWFLTILAYIRYTATAKWQPYVASVICFALGLASKSMLVTVPIVLLLLDFWPLRRIPSPGCTSAKREWMRLFIEKLPYLALSGVLSVVSFLAQQEFGAVASLARRPLDLRLANVLVSYVAYLGKTIWPLDLAAFYPYPTGIPAWKTAGAATFLVFLTVVAIVNWKRRPYLAMGWIWYLVTLLPVIGIVQIGAQAMADRYTYVPLIGVFIALVWLLSDLLRMGTNRRAPVTALAVAVALVLSAVSWNQIGTWQSRRTLWQHAVEVTDDNFIAYCNLGLAYVDEDDLDAAERCFREALRILPDFEDAKHNLTHVLVIHGNRLCDTRRYPEAFARYAEAVDLSPEEPEIYMAMGKAYFVANDVQSAVKAYSKAAALAPERPYIRSNLGVALEFAGQYAASERELEEALRLAPGFQFAEKSLQRVRQKAGQTASDGSSPQ